ncbi:hydrolase, partial [Halobacteriales archaeon QH_8_67_27]
MTVRHDGITVEWLGYATLRFAGEETIVYTDPGRYGLLTGEYEPDTEGIGHPPGRDYRPEDADVVCLTHVHHYDSDGVERVAGEDTTVVAFEAIEDQVEDRDLPPLSSLPYDVVTVGDRDSITVGDIPIWTVPAYNEPNGPHTRPDGTPFHPEGFGCGFLVDVEGKRVL